MINSLRRTQFIALAAGSSVSAFGDAISPIMLAFCILETTHSVQHLALVVGLRAASHVLCLLVAGVAADRYPRVRVMTLSCAASAISQLSLAAAVSWVPGDHLVVVAAAMFNGATTAFYAPAAVGHLPDTVNERELVRANAVYRVASNGAGILGTICASVIVGFFDPAVGLFVDASTFAVAAVVLTRSAGRSRQHGPAAAAVAEPESLRRSLADGWTFFWERFWIKATVAAFAVVNLAFAAAYFVLGPALAMSGLGKSSWSLIAAGQAAGFMIGGLAALRLPSRRELTYGLLCSLPFPGFLLALGLGVPALALVALSAVAGIGLELFNVSWQVVLQSNVPRAYISRMSSYDQLGSFMAIPLGELLAGPLAGIWGVSWTLTVFAAACTAVCLATAMTRRVRAMRVLPSRDAAAAANH